MGKGAAVFANLALTPDGGDFIGSPMFPATLHELLRALRRSSEAQAVTPGTAWVLETPTKGEGALSVTDPEGAAIETQVICERARFTAGVAGGEVAGHLFGQARRGGGGRRGGEY